MIYIFFVFIYVQGLVGGGVWCLVFGLMILLCQHSVKITKTMLAWSNLLLLLIPCQQL
jgi:hypothetical protein